MQIGIKQISIGERVEAAKGDTRPSNTDTSAVPSDINPSPGDSSISPPDAGGINNAGADVNAQTQQGNKATSDGARKTNNPATKPIEYEKPVVSTEDQAPTASKETELASTPAPKTKGFKESLIDSQMSSMMSNKTGGDRGSIDSDFGHNTPDPNIQQQPEAQPLRRDKMDPYNNSNNKVKEPSPFPITSWDKKDTTEPYKAPDQNFGPAYKSKTLNSPKVTSPNVKFNSPKINTPRFN